MGNIEPIKLPQSTMPITEKPIVRATKNQY
jgi:hypothetical protein